MKQIFIGETGRCGTIYISLGVIEHFENGPERALKEAYRILKPGGLAFVSTPYLNVLCRLICHPVRSTYFLIRKLKGRPNYFWEYRFTRKELESYIEKAGFEIIEAVVDDYEPCVRNRHIGLWADWFFMRAEQGAADLTRARWKGKPTRQSKFASMIITPSIVFIRKCSE